MTNLLSSIGTNPYETYALIMGVIGIVSSVFFFLVKYEVIQVNFLIADEMYLWFFAGFTAVSGVIHLLTTVGLIGTGR